MTDTITSLIIARAVALALHRADVAEAATELAATAASRGALERASARIRRGVAMRPSPVGEHAAAAISLALAMVDPPVPAVPSGTLVPVPGDPRPY